MNFGKALAIRAGLRRAVVIAALQGLEGVAASLAQRGDARAAEVVATFGRKRRQLGRCKSGEDEKVRAQFTVAPNGRVTGVKVTGTTNSIKRKCVRDILKQAIFPKGPETNTYAMPFTI